MLTTVHTSKRVTVGSAEYRAARVEAEEIAAEERRSRGAGLVRWDDEYNDGSAVGRFVVTSRR